MAHPRRRGFLSFLLMSALVACLALPAPSQARNPPGGKQKPRVGDPVRFQEAEALRRAFVALAGANHDYDGHRWKAMGATKESFHVLHEAIRKNGTPQQRAGADVLRAEIDAAEQAARQRGPVHEKQSVSDAAMKQGMQMLGQVRASMAAHKHFGALEHVDRALRQIGIALKIR